MHAYNNTAKRSDGRPNWQQIARKVSGRNPIQCCNRYRRHLQHIDDNATSAVRRRHCWGEEEDRALFHAFATTAKREDNRPNWQEIARKVPGRTGQQCCQHYQYLYHNSTSAKRRLGGWTDEEELKLLHAFNGTPKCADGRPNWREIAQKVPGRTPQQCRYRYDSYLDHTRTMSNGSDT